MKIKGFGIPIILAVLATAPAFAQGDVPHQCEVLFSSGSAYDARIGSSPNAQQSRAGNASLSILNSSDFTEIKPLANRRTFLASLRTQRVFIKIPRGGTAEAGAHEIEMMTRLNAIGLSSKFLGVTEVNGRFAIVSEAVEGANTQFPMIADDAVRITKPVQAEMRRQAELLHENQIWPLDLQFMISENGQVKIVDPELFQMDSTRSHGGAEYQNLIDQILINWNMEDKVD